MPATIAELVADVHRAERHVDAVHEPGYDAGNNEVTEQLRDDAVHAEGLAWDALRDYLIAHYPDPGQGEPFAVVLADGSIVCYHLGTVTHVRPEHVHQVAAGAPDHPGPIAAEGEEIWDRNRLLAWEQAQERLAAGGNSTRS
jgi:hypothetical protein